MSDPVASARVFISCGQNNSELAIAQKVAAWFESKGYRPFVALEAQGLQDVNSGTIAELRRSDYLVFIDFCRETLGENRGCRGSLYSHQELAIAHALGLKEAIFFREQGVRVEGISRFMAANAIEFKEHSELIDRLARSVVDRRWSPDYSRNLIVGPLRWHGTIRTPRLCGRFLFVDIQNRRSDIAHGAVARLSRLRVAGRDEAPSPNMSPLKVTGQVNAFSQTIFPDSHGAFDLLCVDVELGSRVYLNTALDLPVVPPLLDEAGEHSLFYEVVAIGFEPLHFELRLSTGEHPKDAQADVVSCSWGPGA